MTAEGRDVMAIEATELTWRDQVELEARRKDIRRAVHVRFGHAAPLIDAVIDNAASDRDLDALFDRALLAQTEDDLLHPGE